MCTVILGWDVVAPGTLVLGANRDEDPARPSDPPGRLIADPPVCGGRDRVAGGTWLAVRERRAVVAMLNRRPSRADLARAWPRSRGRLALEVAAAPEDASAPVPAEVDGALARGALARAWAEVGRESYAPFSLLHASAAACWVASRNSGEPPRVLRLSRGWHVLTHAEVDDAREPRAAHLARDLAAWTPRTPAEAVIGVLARLRSHGGPGPAVCLHQGRMVTVSSSIVWLSRAGARYLHAEGRPCTTPARDHSALLAGAAEGGAA
jgi:uncharacterized protein with NRDE domain